MTEMEAELPEDTGLSAYDKGILDGTCQALTILIPLLNAAEEAARTINKPQWLMGPIRDASEFVECCK